MPRRRGRQAAPVPPLAIAIRTKPTRSRTVSAPVRRAIPAITPPISPVRGVAAKRSSPGASAHRLSSPSPCPSRSRPETSRTRPNAAVSATAIQPRETVERPGGIEQDECAEGGDRRPRGKRDRVRASSGRARSRLGRALWRGVLVQRAGPVAGVLDARAVAVQDPQLPELDVRVYLEPRSRSPCRRRQRWSTSRPSLQLSGDLALPCADVGRAGDADRGRHVDAGLAGSRARPSAGPPAACPRSGRGGQRRDGRCRGGSRRRESPGPRAGGTRACRCRRGSRDRRRRRRPLREPARAPGAISQRAPPRRATIPSSAPIAITRIATGTPQPSATANAAPPARPISPARARATSATIPAPRQKPSDCRRPPSR